MGNSAINPCCNSWTKWICLSSCCIGKQREVELEEEGVAICVGEWFPGKDILQKLQEDNDCFMIHLDLDESPVDQYNTTPMEREEELEDNAVTIYVDEWLPGNTVLQKLHEDVDNESPSHYSPIIPSACPTMLGTRPPSGFETVKIL